MSTIVTKNITVYYGYNPIGHVLNSNNIVVYGKISYSDYDKINLVEAVHELLDKHSILGIDRKYIRVLDSDTGEEILPLNEI